jgi:tRNA modification GTPase
MDTIFAVSSGAPPAAIAVLRISGPRACAAASLLCGTLPSPRRASLRRLVDPSGAGPLDNALVIVFPGPRTATGEDLVELHLHGGRAVVAAVEASLGAIDGLRRAEPGEFTRRALQAGIIDLSEAEGLGDLLAAETETQRRAALTVAEGGIRRRVEAWLARLLTIAAQVEAQLDFSDEDDVPEEDESAIADACRQLAGEMTTILAKPPVERLKDGIRIVLAGPPNSGKSTLINALAERDAAIVSSIAGTTRDRIDVPVRRNGIAYLLTDTAGLAEGTDDPIEAQGIERARLAIEAADVVLWLGDSDAPPGAIWLRARADEVGRAETAAHLSISAHSGLGLDTLWSEIERRAARLLPVLDDIALNARQRDLLSTCTGELVLAARAIDLLMTAEHLRQARNALSAITGRGDTERMLDALFGAFCIGK